MDRLSRLNLQFSGSRSSKLTSTKKVQETRVWESLQLDKKMSPASAEKRKATQLMMEAMEERLIPHIKATTWPDWVFPQIATLGVNGLQGKDFGSPGMTTLEAGSILYEMAKIDGSVAMAFLVQNCLGMAVVDALGDDQQRERLLPDMVKLEKTISFGLTEPTNGSDASNLKTTVKKVAGGFIINGQKRWIGNATFADYITIWARNEAEGNKVQGFLVEKGSKGLRTQKMEGKFACRMTQNADIFLQDVFVPDNMRLTKATDFQKGTNGILRTSRLQVAFWCAGMMAGAYEAALNYTTVREQFGRPIAQFQLIQERLSRMLAMTEFTVSHLVFLAEELDKRGDEITMGQIGRAKAEASRQGREVVALARECLGGNGILLENRVIKHFNDIEVMYTGEGTYDINSLVSGREITGGLSAFK